MRPAFIPLPPGAVEPAGWLRDWCLTARDGYTGHLDKIDPANFRDAWRLDEVGKHLQKSNRDFGLEATACWLDGLLRLGYCLHDQGMIDKARTRMNGVLKRRPPGKSFLFFDEAALDYLNGWFNGLFGQLVYSDYEATGSQEALDALTDVCVSFSRDRHWKPTLQASSGSAKALGAASNLSVMYEVYTRTGDRRILDAMMRFANEEKVVAVFGRISSQGGVYTKHGGENDILSKVPLFFYPWAGREIYRAASLKSFDTVIQSQELPQGGVSGELMCGIGAARPVETCALYRRLEWLTWLSRLIGSARFADDAETIVFNAFPNTVNRAFNQHVYGQRPNRVADGKPGGTWGYGCGNEDYRETPPGWPCCLGALNRILPEYITHMWMATYDNGLAALHYGPCNVTALAGDRVPVRLACRTDYPFGEVIEVAVTPEREALFSLRFRIPGWCDAPEVVVDGSDQSAGRDGNGFIRVERTWKPGDTVRLHFPMRARVAAGRETAFTPGKTGQDYNAFQARDGAPYATVRYGPLLFALPIPDTRNANTPDKTAEWQFALDVSGKAPAFGVTAERGAMPARWDWPLDSPLKLRARAQRFDWKIEDERVLPPGPVTGQEATREITLVPYGCAKFRVSVFPVTERAWKLLGAQRPAGSGSSK
jgi:hypothetical protein